MRSLSRAVTGAGVAALVVAVVLAFVVRNGTGAGPAVAVVLALLGLVLVAVALALMVASERDASDLQLSDEQQTRVDADSGLPWPTFWAPAAAAAAAVAAVGMLLSTFLLGLGLGMLLAVAVVAVLETLQRRHRTRSADSPTLDRVTVRTARRILRFGRTHAAEESTAVAAVVEYLGRYGAKLVLVGADGRFGELVVRDVPRAQAAARLAGATVSEEFERELIGRMHQTTDEWSRMGGRSVTTPSKVAERTA